MRRRGLVSQSDSNTNRSLIRLAEGGATEVSSSRDVRFIPSRAACLVARLWSLAGPPVTDLVVTSVIIEMEPSLVAELVVDDLWEYTGGMPKAGTPPLQGDLIQGTLDLLILRTLVLGPAHGHTIAHAIERRSDDVLQVEHGSLYPALHRLEDRGWIASFWGTSENNRKARYYRLTPAGRKQLAEQTSRWDELVEAINRVLRPTE